MKSPSFAPIPGERFGITATAAIVVFLALGTQTALAAGKDGWQPGDAMSFLPLVPVAGPVLKGLPQAADELKELHELEAAELVELVKEQISDQIPSDRVETIVAASLDILPKLAALVRVIQDPPQPEDLPPGDDTSQAVKAEPVT